MIVPRKELQFVQRPVTPEPLLAGGGISYDLYAMSIRLLQANGRCFHSIMGDTIPEYAILSHTWEDEQITFQLTVQGDPKHLATNKSCYRKIVNTC